MLYSKFVRRILLTLGIVATILMIVLSPIYTPALLIGGVLANGLLGKITQKVGGAVFFNWKSINAVRSYAKPANPQSPAQVIQRARMARCVLIGRQLLGVILQPFWDPFYNDKSGYNAWVSENIMKLAATTYNLQVTNVMSKGSLLGVDTLAYPYDTSDGSGTIGWDDNTNGTTGLATDIFCYVISSLSGEIYDVAVTSATRADGAFAPTMPSGLTASNIIVFGFFKRGTGSEVLVSDSSAVIATAA